MWRFGKAVKTGPGEGAAAYVCIDIGFSMSGILSQ